ncbi:hypothetical protein D9M68_937280 [compost metagenome]
MRFVGIAQEHNIVMQLQLLQYLQPAQRNIQQHSIPGIQYLLVADMCARPFLQSLYKSGLIYLTGFKIGEQIGLCSLRIAIIKVGNA